MVRTQWFVLGKVWTSNRIYRPRYPIFPKNVYGYGPETPPESLDRRRLVAGLRAVRSAGNIVAQRRRPLKRAEKTSKAAVKISRPTRRRRQSVHTEKTESRYQQSTAKNACRGAGQQNLSSVESKWNARRSKSTKLKESRARKSKCLMKPKLHGSNRYMNKCSCMPHIFE